MQIQDAELKLDFKIFHYTGSEDDQDFLEKRFGVVASDYDFDWDDPKQKVKPAINTVNYGRVFVEKGDYLIYWDDDDSLVGKLFKYADQVILLPADSWSENVQPGELTVEDLVDNGALKITGEKQ